MTPDEEAGETPCKIDVEYEWIPPKCTSCMMLGHAAKDCTLNKPSKPIKPPVTVYVPKTGLGRLPPVHDQEIIPPTRGVDKQRDRRESPSGGAVRSSQEDKAIWNVRGLNKRDHQLAVQDIVDEFRLQFIGLLETRVRGNNASLFQSILLPQWKWFTDYGSSGNRVWIAWDDNFVDVDVVECGTQFIHCHVATRAPHELIVVTVVYGANEVAERRALWGTLETKATQCIDIPWLVGGDFNAVRDLSEVCGTSRDIKIAMDDFNACIENAGLLPLPMQGEWLTWHNRSATPRNLWKRLDRMMINDRWMARFPNASYSTLTPRTSDHSPMVLHGDRQQRFGGMFRFNNYLVHSPEFIASVKNIWQHNIIGTPMYSVTRKLKALKSVFREQRRNKGDLSHNVQLAKGFLEAAQILVSSSRRDELYIQLEHYCRLVLTKAAKMEQTMLQRAKMQWMKGGGERRQTVIDLRFLQPWARHVLTVEEASSLLLPVTQADVKQEVFDIGEDKAPGPDGYSSGFFKAAWPIVGQEIIVQRLSVILDKLISPGQAAFVHGRSIGDNIMLAQELFTGYNQSRLPPKCALKWTFGKLMIRWNGTS
ncbi:uncharacterized protein LOC105179617 [Sesamum indicum]|uniref:Uncharacterized protein LOC105179617 n=1 Tax=Sesamum indicum TaxID=4182 RepID=A0A6I9UPS4_SESIN|nr:uncharacterized protein LOC105179617 [Sesamum indicum]